MEISKYFAVFSICYIMGGIEIFAFEDTRPLIIVRDLNEGHTVTGGTIRLECQTTFDSRYVSIKWFKHSVPVNPNFIKTEGVTDQKSNSSWLTVSRLTIPNAPLQYGSSLYTCQAVHKDRPYFEFSDELILSVWDKNSHGISFGQVDQFRSAALEITVSILAHPNISSLTWVHHGNETVVTNSIFDNQNKLSHKWSNYYAKFRFQTLTVEDFGEYSVIAKNQFENQTISFSVDLSNDTIINLTLDETDQNGLGTYKCEVLSFPKKAVTWTFTKYSDHTDLADLLRKNYRNGTELKASKAEENGLKVTSYASVNFTETGFLECHVGSLSKGVHILVVQDGFDIFAENLVRDGNVVHTGYRQPTTLVCAVSTFNYTNKLIWNSNESQSSYISTNLVATTVHFSPNEEKNLTCEAFFRTGKIETRTVKVVPKKVPNLHPHMLMEDKGKGHNVEGQFLEVSCKVIYYEKVKIEWYFLNDTWQALDSAEDLGEELNRTDFYQYVTTSRFTTTGQISKTGFYKCEAKTGSRTFWEEIWVPVYNISSSVIKFDKKASIFDKARKQIRVWLNAHPKPTIQWFGNNGEVIPPATISTRYTSKTSGNNYVTTLTFGELSLGDNGKYTVVAQSAHHNESFSMVVNVRGIPTSRMEVDRLDEDAMTSVIKCFSVGYPEPEVRWYFQECGTLETCLDKINEKAFREVEELRHERTDLETISYISVDLSKPGIFRCLSRNAMGKNYTDEPIFYVKNKIEIFAKDSLMQESTETIEMLDNEKLKLICAASIHHYTEDIDWNFGDSIIENTDSFYKRHDSKLLLSFISILDLTPTWDFQQYSCNGLTRDGLVHSRKIQVKTREQGNLIIQKTNMVNQSVEVNYGEGWKFECLVEGFPTPTISWLKDNDTIRVSGKLKLSNGDQELQIDDIDSDDEGEYTCQVSNRIDVLTAKLKLTIPRAFQWTYVLVPVAAFSVVALLLIYLKIRKQRSLSAKLKAAGLFNFENGNLDGLDPELGIENQADLLPYDKKWEIPLDNIKLDKQLGSGAFGVVFKAKVTNFFDGENEKIVAIKTTNSTARLEHVKNLASELKIMSHLGKHVNIVNLLGACTKNLVKRQLYVVVEFCAFGNLEDHLRRHSKNFVDQKNYEMDEFDWTIEADDDTTTDDIDVDEAETSARYSKTPQLMYSKDFLIWAFQICRGMEYLSSRRIVHGDLAARNVLLAEDNVVKVSDFGLARKMNQDGDYVKKGPGLLPVKWMAIESIKSGVFSIQSDVWSFGVVLWEFFSLGGIPYPGLIFDEDFHKKLVGGYRMEAPKTATTAIYTMMVECWNSDPVLRPSFQNLIEKLGLMLEDTVKNHYIDMNNDYLVMNSPKEEEDYLAMVNLPTFENVAGSSGNLGRDYVNSSYVSEGGSPNRGQDYVNAPTHENISLL